MRKGRKEGNGMEQYETIKTKLKVTLIQFMFSILQLLCLSCILLLYISLLSLR